MGPPMGNEYRKKEPPKQPGIDITQYMSLSLMILLLAFFIMLNAISSFQDTKVNPRIESIDKKFATKAVGDTSLPARIASADNAGGAGEAFDNIEGNLKSQGIPFTSQRLRGNSVLFVRVPEQRFLAMIGLGNASDSDEKNIFLGKLVMMMMPAANIGVRYRMNIMLALGDNPATIARENPDKVRARIHLADRMANMLIKHRFDPAYLTAGLQSGTEGFIDIYFETVNPAIKEISADEENFIITPEEKEPPP